MKKNLITTTILLTTSPFILAQTDTAMENLSTINVYSAYATPVNQDQTASSVTVLTEKEFAARNATYVSDVLKTVPGVAIAANGGRGTLTSLFLRGADSNHTTVIIDGVRANPINGDGFDFGGLSLSNIDRIEILRGEQSALWGSNALGGVIYITTKSGLYKDKPFNVDFDLGTGSHGTYDGSITLSGYNNGFYYSLHGDSHRTRGISTFSEDEFRYTSSDGTKEIVTGGATERDKFHSDNVSARFGYADEQKGLELLASHTSQTVHFDDTADGRAETAYDDYTRTRNTLFKLSGYLGNTKERFKQQFSFSHLKTDIDTFAYGLNYNTFQFENMKRANDAKRLSANYQLDINFDREGSLTQAISLLANYEKSNYDANNYIDEKKLIEKSAALEYRLFSENDHSLSIGGRYIDNSQYENAWTGRIAGAYRLSQHFRTHASFGKAIQNPTFIEYFGYSGNFIGNPNLKPEKSIGGDLGLLIESTDKKHSLDITYFARNVENFISTNATWTQAINLDGKTKIKGVEIAYNGQLTNNLTAYANYTYTNSRDSQNQDLLRRPKHMANAGLAYQVTEKLGSDINISYVGKRTDTYYDEATWTSYRAKMPSYTLVNLGANYQVTENLNVYVNLNNLFDKKYENVLGYGQDGRNIYVGLKGSF